MLAVQFIIGKAHHQSITLSSPGCYPSPSDKSRLLLSYVSALGDLGGMLRTWVLVHLLVRHNVRPHLFPFVPTCKSQAGSWSERQL